MTKAMHKIRALFNHNRFLMVFSLVLAIVIWFVVSIAYSPQTSRNISQVPVEITFPDSASGYRAFTDGDLFTTVEVTGKKYVIEQLSADSLVVSATAESITASGMYTLDLQARKKANNADYTVVSVMPSTVRVMIDALRETTFDVSIDCVGAKVETLAGENENLLLVPAFANEQHATVTVSGPESEVSKIASVAAVAQVNQTLTESTQYTAGLVAYDSAGRVLYDYSNHVSSLNYVTFSYESTEVIANVNLRRVLPLACSVVGAPANQPDIILHEITGSEGDQDTVVTTISVQGAESAVSALEELTLEGTVDFSKIDPDEPDSFRFELRLPNLPGVSFDEYANISDLYFVAQVDDTGLRARSFDVSADRVTVNNLPAGYRAAVRSALKGITVVGPASVVDGLTANDLVVTVDGSSADSPGAVTLTPKIQVRNTSTCWIAGNYQVVVEITAA